MFQYNSVITLKTLNKQWIRNTKIRTVVKNMQVHFQYGLLCQRLVRMTTSIVFVLLSNIFIKTSHFYFKSKLVWLF